MKTSLFKNIGPGTLVAAAFIGPGTVTACTQAGVQFGYALLWALLLSMIATMVLQEMAARLGIISGKGLAAAIKDQISIPWVRVLAIVLIFSAIIIGNSAYEAGNITGGALGLQAIIPNSTAYIAGVAINTPVILVGVIAFVLLYLGNYKVLERSLIGLVLLMSVSFILAAILTGPAILDVFSGLFIPTQPKDSLFTIIALIGTTVVPYNLFLHASLVREKWNSSSDLKHVRKDTLVSIALGGLVSIAIVICGAGIQGNQIESAVDLAKGLAPLYGNYATYFIGIALFAAGITSAITAPMAAAYVARGCFGWDKSLKDKRFRAVWIFVLLMGVVFSLVGKSPIQVIYFAQVANGLLLPLIAVFLVWVANNSNLMGNYKNKLWQNAVGIVIIAICLLLSYRTLTKVIGAW